jgi:nitroreductase
MKERSAIAETTMPETTEALEFIYQRHSTRAFKTSALTDAVIRQLLEAAVHAPTAMHEEPWRFVVVQDRAVLERISGVAKKLATSDAATHGRLLKPPGAAGDGIASILADPNFNVFYDAGTVVVIGTETANDFTIADCWLAAENLMLAAPALGLASCCIGFAIAALNTPGIKAELGIPAAGRAVAAIALGEPRDAAPVVPRTPPVIGNWLRG